MEDEHKIKQQILNLYKIFEFEAEDAQEFGMHVNIDSEENDSQGLPETQ